jgi:hypothetical protein
MTSTAERLETGHEVETSSDDSLLRQFLLNQSTMNKIFAEHAGGTHAFDGELSLSDAGSAVAFLNQAVLHRPVLDDTDRVLDRIDSFFAESPSATMLSAWPTPDLTRRGWVLMGHPMFVVAPPGAVATKRRPGVEVSRVGTERELAAAERVVIDGYPIPEAAGAPTGSLLVPSMVDSGFGVWLGHLDGEAVGVGAELTEHGVVNLAMDATLPSARRRGVWRSLVAERTAFAPDLPAVAFTSDFSRPGFVAMGFMPITRFTLWLRPA